MPALDKKYKHDIDVVVDRIVVRGRSGGPPGGLLETALKLADGLAVAEFADKPLPAAETSEESANKSKNETHERMLFSEKFACPVSGFTIAEIEPRLFSFNNPFGACPTCDGLGSQRAIDASLIVPDENRSLARRRRQPVGEVHLALLHADAGGARQSLRLQARRPLQGPFATRPSRRSCTAPARGKSPSSYDDGLRSYKTTKTFEGVIPNLERRWKETESAWMREEIERFMSATPCPACNGYRLKPEALAVKIAGTHIGQVTGDVDPQGRRVVHANCRQRSTPKQNEIAARILKEIRERLRFLNDVGLDYLTLSRNSGTLSGGESQRIRLASQIGSGLTGVLYVLDEPSIGLHQRDNAAPARHAEASARPRQHGDRRRA